jgi:hypothetical protein
VGRLRRHAGVEGREPEGAQPRLGVRAAQRRAQGDQLASGVGRRELERAGDQGGIGRRVAPEQRAGEVAAQRTQALRLRLGEQQPQLGAEAGRGDRAGAPSATASRASTSVRASAAKRRRAT